jgi:hypothetical protein
VEGRVVSAPVINSKITDVAVIEMGTDPRPGEVDRLIKLLSDAMAAAKADAEERR